MTKEEYEDYRESPHWQATSRRIRQFRRVCEKCLFPYELNVHHKTYATLGRERDDDLIVLCRSCHSREHFLNDIENYPAYLTEQSKREAIKRIKTDQAEARKKNIEREYEIKKYKERENE